MSGSGDFWWGEISLDEITAPVGSVLSALGLQGARWDLVGDFRVTDMLGFQSLDELFLRD